VLFFRLQDVLEQFARDVVGHLFAIRDRLPQVRMRLHFQLQVAVQRFLHALADQQLAQVLQVGQPIQEQDALDELVGVLHLIDRFLVRVLAEALEPPVLEHAGVQKILVDGRQFVFQNDVEVAQYGCVTLHVSS
jgi:hypothetical protein